MKQKPFFSIVVVTLNAEKTLKKCLQSVIKQTFKDWEIVAIDGVSTDNTLKILKKHKKHITFLSSETDSGIYDAMNKGAKNAKGEFVYFLNADDEFFDNNVLTDVHSFIESQDKKVGVLTANVIKVYPGFSVLKNNQLNRQNLKKSIMPPHQSMFIDKDVFNRIGGHKLNFRASGDLEFCCNLVKHNVKSVYLDRVIAKFAAGGMSSHKEIAYPENYQIIKEYFGNFAAIKYFIKKIVIEQSIKKVLKFLHLNKLSELFTKLIMNSVKE